LAEIAEDEGGEVKKAAPVTRKNSLLAGASSAGKRARRKDLAQQQELKLNTRRT